MESGHLWLSQQKETENIQSIMTMAVEFWAGEDVIGFCLARLFHFKGIVCMIKFRFSKKATKFETISQLIWRLLSKCQIRWEIVSKFCDLFRMFELYKNFIFHLIRFEVQLQARKILRPTSQWLPLFTRGHTILLWITEKTSTIVDSRPKVLISIAI